MVCYQYLSNNTIGRFFVTITSSYNVIDIVQAHLLEIYARNLYPDIPQLSKESSEFDIETAVSYLYRKKISIPNNYFITNAYTFFQALVSNEMKSPLNLNNIENISINSLFKYDIIEVSPCRGCQMHMTVNYCGLLEHQGTYGCLKPQLKKTSLVFDPKLGLTKSQ
ncbi:MAG: hypothetical protein R6U89_05415 [Dehalococcoidia bacterium]